MNRKFRKRMATIAATACMVAASVAPVCAATGNFHFRMYPFNTQAINTTGTARKGTDGDKRFYVTPTGGSWSPGYDYPHAYAINLRGQECNRNTSDNLLSAYNHRVIIPYYYRSVPGARQEMNIKIKEFKEGVHNYSMDGRWTP